MIFNKETDRVLWHSPDGVLLVVKHMNLDRRVYTYCLIHTVLHAYNLFYTYILFVTLKISDQTNHWLS